MNQNTTAEANQVCQSCAQAEGLKTLYVHFCSGLVEVVEGVTGVETTQKDIIFRRGQDEAVTFRRQDVFYTCCDVNALGWF
ncbi:MAG TPA: hypothetical protein VG845_03350 [Dehalococcoidia bacterium]|nr:hypothetical protein [Dehalococcoidia bacterium]